jgi:aminotransferase class V
LSHLQIAKRTGAVIDLILDDADGRLDPQALEMMIDDHVRLIAITWVPTNGGLVNPAAEVGWIASSGIAGKVGAPVPSGLQLARASGIQNVFVNDFPMKRIASIPFMRNLIEVHQGRYQPRLSASDVPASLQSRYRLDNRGRPRQDL